MPGISAKTVHFPPWPAWAPAPQAPLAALSVSTLGESAGNFRENGSLSPGAVHFSSWVETFEEVQQGILWEVLSIQAL